jgi:hypothetical protein
MFTGEHASAIDVLVGRCPCALAGHRILSLKSGKRLPNLSDTHPTTSEAAMPASTFTQRRWLTVNPGAAAYPY